MTAYSVVFLSCDLCAIDTDFFEPTTAVVRRNAVTQGWTNKGRHDYCPECTKVRRRPVPSASQITRILDSVSLTSD